MGFNTLLVELRHIMQVVVVAVDHKTLHLVLSVVFQAWVVVVRVVVTQLQQPV